MSFIILCLAFLIWNHLIEKEIEDEDFNSGDGVCDTDSNGNKPLPTGLGQE